MAKVDPFVSSVVEGWINILGKATLLEALDTVWVVTSKWAVPPMNASDIRNWNCLELY